MISKELAHIVYHQKHIVPPHIIKALSDPEIMEQAIKADNDPTVNIRLTIAAMQGLSLETTQKGQPRKTVGEEGTYYCIYFHTVGNPFLQIISVPNDSSLIAEMDAAIEANLASPKYAAALYYRQRQPEIVKEQAALVEVARRAHYKALDQKKGIEAAEEAYEKALDKEKIEALDEEIRMLSRQACPAIAGKGYSDWLAELLYQNLPFYTSKETI